MIRLALLTVLLGACPELVRAAGEEPQLTRGASTAPADPSQVRPRPSYKVTTFGAEDGVPSRTVRGLAFDSDGLLWLGTNGGIATFDGLEFNALRASETSGLVTDRILSVVHSSQGDIWFGTDRGPLMRHREGSFESFSELQRLTDVKQIFEASDGTMWFFGHAIASFKDERFTVLMNPVGLDGYGVQRAVETGDGTILIATDRGLLKVVDGQALEVVDSTPLCWVIRGFGDDAWVREVGTGLAYRVGDDPSTGEHVDVVVIYDELELGSHRRLIAADRGVLLLMPDKDEGAMPRLLLLRSSDEVLPRSLERGANGEVWMGTARGGLHYLEKNAGVPVPLEGTREDAQRSVGLVASVGGENLVVSTSDSGVTAMVDGYGARQIISNPTGTDRWIAGACAAPGDRVLIATAEGLGYLKEGHVRLLPDYPGAIDALVRSDDGSIWYSQGPMVKEFLIDGGVPREFGPFSIGSSGFWATKGRILRSDFGVLEGVDLGTGKVDVMCELPEMTIRGVFESRDGSLWISTYGDGIVRLASDGQIHSWSVAEGLPDPFLGWIGDPSGGGGAHSLWLNSNRGTICVDVDSLERVLDGTWDTIRCRLDVGPEGNGTAGATLPGGFLALPTVEGLRVIDTSRITASRPAPSTLIQSVEANGTHWDPALSLVGSATLRYSFAALVFPSARGTHYRYRLAGYDENWVDVGKQRSVRFTNLPPGDYSFEVQSRAADSDWSLPVPGPVISIGRRWDQRTDVRVLLALVAASVLWALYVWRMRSVRHQYEELAQEVERRRVVERALRECAQSYANTLETAIDGIVTCDVDGTVNYVNPALERILGVHSSDVEGKSIRILDVIGEGGGLDRIIDGIASGGATRAETVLAKARHSDGTAIDLEMTIGRAGSNGSERLVCVVRDVGERLRLGRQLDRLRGRLVKAEESERSRIARELHDDLSQRLAALALDAQIVRAGVTQMNGSKVPGAVERIRDGLEAVAVDVHALSRRLHPTVVDDLGLARALRSECKQRRFHGDLVIDFVDETEGIEIPNAVGLSFFRIAQESLRNAERHAEASTVQVALSVLGGSAMLKVTDDGKGFDSSQRHSLRRGGIGLVSMRERAKFVHGFVAITSKPGRGTEVRVEAPLGHVSQTA